MSTIILLLAISQATEPVFVKIDKSEYEGFFKVYEGFEIVEGWRHYVDRTVDIDGDDVGLNTPYAYAIPNSATSWIGTAAIKVEDEVWSGRRVLLEYSIDGSVTPILKDIRQDDGTFFGMWIVSLTRDAILIGTRIDNVNPVEYYFLIKGHFSDGELPADLNRDGIVDSGDLFVLKSQWHEKIGVPKKKRLKQ